MADVLHMFQREAGAAVAPSRFSRPVVFERPELNQILSLYTRRVIDGDWCDYAINLGDHEAVFTIYGGKAGVAAYRIVKRARGGDSRFRVLASGGQIVRMAGSLAEALSAIPKRRKLKPV